MDCASAIAGTGTVVGICSNSSLRSTAKISGLSVKWNREESFSAPSSFDQNIKREKGASGGMRSVASAPDFSQLKMMHENSRIPDPKFKSQKNSEQVCHCSELPKRVQQCSDIDIR